MVIATGANVEAKVKSLALEDALHVDLSRPDDSDFRQRAIGGLDSALVFCWRTSLEYEVDTPAAI